MNADYSRLSSLLGTLAATVLIACGSHSHADEVKKVTYVDHVQPIFRQHCFACHGPDMKKNDLALNTYASVIAGGASGDAVIAGDTSSSYLWLLVNHELEPAMPPGGAKLPQAELDTIKAWIEGGLLEKGDSVAKKSAKPAVAMFTPTADNKPEGEPAMPEGLFKEPVVQPPREGSPTAVATSPWAPLAAIGAAYQITLYNTDTGELLGVLPFVEGSPYVLRFSRDGSILLAGGGKSGALGIVALFDVKTGRRLTTIGDELDAVLAADIRADHSLVALGGPRKVVRVYKVADGSLAYEITKHTDWVTALEFSPDGKLLATADRSTGLLLWDAETGRDRGDLRGHTEPINSISWRGDSAVLASTSEDDTIRLWNVAEVKQIKSWSAHIPGSNSVQFARDGQIVSSGRDGIVKTWKADGAAIRNAGKLDDLALAARFTHDGKRIVAADWRGNVRLFDAEKGEAVATLTPYPPTIDARLAATEAEVNALRAAAEAAKEQLAAAQQQVAAAQSALEQAQKDAAAKSQVESAAAAKLGTAEERMAAAEKEKAELAEATSKIAADMEAAEGELAAAEAAAKAKAAERDESKTAMDKQEAVVNAVAAQIADLQKKLEEAQAALAPLTEAYAQKDQEVAGADSKVGETQARIAELERRQKELEAIQKLRAQFSAAR